ncbi:alpha/beta hydrolase [Enterobacter hormaechei subsp. xiangfangensis]|nr:alpha/beta hydrolase [Enterobacter hormaechei subsp. xiangfangensis]MCU2750765.1 alpha/beta hydrolase [Enterobacter hormaechei subsp. xiangfangensis]MCU2995566.1 alpha/beta hydrolase [Enterobacter hormaechei subsp. xiangfangensis]
MATFKAKDGTQIYYKDCGAGKPVLFSHGWPLDGDMWDSQLNYLAERGFRAIAFDRRGFGRSDQPWNGYDYDTFASDINDLITTLDLRDVTLVGFSMGGGDVTRYINNYGSERVAGLALLGGSRPFSANPIATRKGWIRACSTAFATGCVKIAPSSSATSPPRSTVSMPGRPFPPVP